MLKIVRSGFSSGGKEEAKKEIINLISEGKRALMIVPEQQTVMSELEFSKVLPSFAPLYFEVTNFTRLANSTFRSLGGINGEYCDNGKKALMMWRTLTELSHTLSLTKGRRDITSGMVESALSAVGEMQSLSISPEALSLALDSEIIKTNKRLYTKLSDLSMIYFLYKKLLSERYLDSGDDCEIMKKKLKENPDFLSDCHIYIDGFTSFTEPQYDILGLLAGRAELTVILATSKHTEDFFEESELKETKERLIGVSRKNFADIKLLDRGGSFCDCPESISLLISRLWRKNADFDNITLQNDEEIRIFESETPFDECSFIASDIKRRVMSGASYRDFAVIIRSEDNYSGILDRALKLSQIPYFSGAKRDAEAYEAIKMIYSAYSAIRSDFSKEDVLTYLKCGLTGICREDCDLFESYVDTWGITGSRFSDELLWNMNPDGYTDRRSPEADGLLVRINETRKRLMSPLIDLSCKLRDAETVREHTVILLDFLLSLNIEKALKEASKRLSALGEGELAEENSRLWGLICSSLDSLIEVMGDSPCTSDGFIDRLKILFHSASMGKIPAHYDEVSIGCADQIRLFDKKHIYLAGVNDGVFPAIPSDSSYFTENDKEILSGIGLGIHPELNIKGARELYIFSRALSYAKESVTLLYSATNARFKKTEPSEVINKIVSLTGGAVKAVRISSLPLKDRLFDPRAALEDSCTDEYLTVRAALFESGFGEEVNIREKCIDNSNVKLSREYRDALADRDLRLSQSKINAFDGCPFSYFCDYTLSLSPEVRAEFDSSHIGTLIHSILENFFTSLRENGMKAGDITPEERVKLTRDAAKKYISELGEDMNNSARTKIKIDRLCRASLPIVEDLCDEFSVSEFAPKFFELSIRESSANRPAGENGLTVDPIRIKISEEDAKKRGNQVIIGGSIDRVDTYEKDGDVYVRVVDYKTGKKDFSPDDLAEGKNLQMFLYLLSLTENNSKELKTALGAKDNGRIIPAGVLYHKAFIGEEALASPDDALALKTVKEKQKRVGMLLDDEEIIRAMGLKYTPLYDPKHPEEINGKKQDLLFTEEQFKDDLKSTVESSVRRVASRIKNGDISAEPKTDGDNSPCNYCKFKPICRKAVVKKKF